MGRLSLRQNVGERLIVESPLGKMSILIDSANNFGVRLSFQGSTDYSIYREEARNKALQNHGAFPVYYGWSNLIGTHWTHTQGYTLYDLVSPTIKQHFDKLSVEPLDSPRGAIERDLKHFRIIAGSNRVVALARESTLVLTLGFDNFLTPAAMKGFVNSFKFEATPAFFGSYGFNQYKGVNGAPSFFNLMRIDTHA